MLSLTITDVKLSHVKWSSGATHVLTCNRLTQQQCLPHPPYLWRVNLKPMRTPESPNAKWQRHSEHKYKKKLFATFLGDLSVVIVATPFHRPVALLADMRACTVAPWWYKALKAPLLLGKLWIGCNVNYPEITNTIATAIFPREVIQVWQFYLSADLKSVSIFTG